MFMATVRTTVCKKKLLSDQYCYKIKKKIKQYPALTATITIIIRQQPKIKPQKGKIQITAPQHGRLSPSLFDKELPACCHYMFTVFH